MWLVEKTEKMEKDTKEQLRKIQQQFSVVNAKLSYLQDGLKDAKGSFEELSSDFNLFIDLYSRDMDKVNERLDRLENYVGL